MRIGRLKINSLIGNIDTANTGVSLQALIL